MSTQHTHCEFCMAPLTVDGDPNGKRIRDTHVIGIYKGKYGHYEELAFCCDACMRAELNYYFLRADE